MLSELCLYQKWQCLALRAQPMLRSENRISFFSLLSFNWLRSMQASISLVKSSILKAAAALSSVYSQNAQTLGDINPGLVFDRSTCHMHPFARLPSDDLNLMTLHLICYACIFNLSDSLRGFFCLASPFYFFACFLIQVLSACLLHVDSLLLRFLEDLFPLLLTT